MCPGGSGSGVGTGTGGWLAYWRSAADAATSPLLGRLDLSACHATLDGHPSRRGHPFAVVGPSGGTLARFAAADGETAAAWVAALVDAGARAGRPRAPPPRAAPAPTASSPARGGARTGYTSDSAASDGGAARGGGGGPLPPRGPPPLQQRRRYDDSPSAAVHTDHRDSMLSVKAVFGAASAAAAATEAVGVRNFMAIIVVLANFRLVLENVLKYGVLVSPVMWARMVYPGSECCGGEESERVSMCFVDTNGAPTHPPHPPSLADIKMALAWPAMAAAYALSYSVEAWAASRVVRGEARAARRARGGRPPRAAARAAAATTDALAAAGHALAAAFALAAPCALTWMRAPHLSSPVPGFVVVLCSIVTFIKIVSFGHASDDLRGRARARLRAWPPKPTAAAPPTAEARLLLFRRVPRMMTPRARCCRRGRG